MRGAAVIHQIVRAGPRGSASGARVGEHEQQNPFEGWTTAEQASNIVKRRRSTIQYWIDSGAIRAFRVGHNTILVNIDEVQRYAASHPPREEG